MSLSWTTLGSLRQQRELQLASGRESRDAPDAVRRTLGIILSCPLAYG